MEEETSSSPEPANENSRNKAFKPSLVNGLSTESSDFEEIFLPEVRHGDFEVVLGFYTRNVSKAWWLRSFQGGGMKDISVPLSVCFGTLVRALFFV